MNKPIKGLLFRSDGTYAQVVYEDYKDITRFLGVDEWTVIYRSFNGIRCTIYLDDCGLYRDNHVVTAVSDNYREALVGNLLICKAGCGGEDESLTESELQMLFDRVVNLHHWVDGKWKSNNVIVFDTIKSIGGDKT